MALGSVREFAAVKADLQARRDHVQRLLAEAPTVDAVLVALHQTYADAFTDALALANAIRNDPHVAIDDELDAMYRVLDRWRLSALTAADAATRPVAQPAGLVG